MIAGSYILVLYVNKDISIPVGSLGFVGFERGYYIYVGSGLRGLRSRINRYYIVNMYRGGVFRIRWHIDYLVSRSDVEICGSIAFIDQDVECRLSKHLTDAGLNGVDRFGSSDCGCRSHLFRVDYGDLVRVLDLIFRDYCRSDSCVLI